MLRHTLNTRKHVVIPITLVLTTTLGHDEAAHTLRWTQRNYKVQNVPSCALVTKIGPPPKKNPHSYVCVAFAQFD